MGFMACGRKVREDERSVAYAFGTSPEDADGGVLVIPVDDVEAWYVDGAADARPPSARRVAGKAVRLRERCG